MTIVTKSSVKRCVAAVKCLFSRTPCLRKFNALRLPRLGKRELILVRFVRFAFVYFCLFPLPLGVWEGLRFVIVALPGLFSYLFLTKYIAFILQVLIICFVRKGLEKCFTQRELKWLDDILPSASTTGKSTESLKTKMV